MLGRLLNFLLSAATTLIGVLLVLVIRILGQILSIFIGASISAGVRLSPILFRMAVMATAELISALDRNFDGRITRSRTITFLTAGGLWAFVGFLFTWLLFLGIRATGVIVSITTGCFLAGLICGFQAQRLPGWRSWTSDEGLQLGDNI